VCSRQHTNRIRTEFDSRNMLRGEQPRVRGQRAHERPISYLQQQVSQVARSRCSLPSPRPRSSAPRCSTTMEIQRLLQQMDDAAGQVQVQLALAKAEILCAQMQHNDGNSTTTADGRYPGYGYGSMFMQNGHTLNSTAAHQQQLRFGREHSNDDAARSMPQESLLLAGHEEQLYVPRSIYLPMFNKR
jgi:hypothetical protein